MLLLENELLKVRIKPFGAELCSLFHKKNGIEYLWQAGPAWPKTSPLLFPIVGQLKENRYAYNGKEYTLPRHGFARERMFSVVETAPDGVLLRLQDDETTRSVYPFQFILDTRYRINGSQLTVTWEIRNTGSDLMYFSIGAHPAFRVPLDVRDCYSDYFLRFDCEETSGRWPLHNGLTGTMPTPFFTDQSLRLTPALFHQDALVFKNPESDFIELRSDRHAHGLRFGIYRCPYLGLWAAKDAPFLCIEPWHGIADSITATGQLTEKEGIQTLHPGLLFTASWSVAVF